MSITCKGLAGYRQGHNLQPVFNEETVTTKKNYTDRITESEAKTVTKKTYIKHVCTRCGFEQGGC